MLQIPPFCVGKVKEAFGLSLAVQHSMVNYNALSSSLACSFAFCFFLFLMLESIDHNPFLFEGFI